MLEKFTEKALKSVILAQQETKEMQHPQITTEHLLLGLISEGTGIAVRVLKAVGISYETLKEEIKEIHAQSAYIEKGTEIAFSAQAIKAIKMANEKAKNLGYIYVGSEHIFLALLSRDEFGAVKVLNKLDVDINRIIETVTRITVKRSINRAHPEIQASKKLTEISRAIQSQGIDLPINIDDEQTKALLNEARIYMQTNGNDTIGTEHLILALTESENSPVKEFLANEGLNKEAIMNILAEQKNRLPEYEGLEYQLTPRASASLEFSQDIATKLGYGTVKPEHLLLGILKQDKCMANTILKKLDINNKYLYEKLISPIEKQKPPTFIILKLAQEEARRLEYNVVGTEHMLLGLLCSGFGLAGQVLNRLGVTLKDTRQEVENIVGFGSGTTTKEMSFTPRAKRLLEIAWDEAKKAQAQRIESEHILLGITRLKDCMAMKILTGLGVDAIEIKEGINLAFIEKRSKDSL